MTSRWQLAAVILVGPLAGTASGGAQAPSASTTLNRAAAVYAHVTTARGTFEQTLTNPLTGSSETARGDFQQERPSRLAVRFTNPAGDRIVADGKWVWVYIPSATPGQVVRMPVSDAKSAPNGGAVSLDFISQFLTDPATRFTVTGAGSDTVIGHRTAVVILTPRSADDQVTHAKLWIDESGGLVRQFEVTDPSGTVRQVRVVTESLNVPVDRAAFEFTPPPGVKVIDQSSLVNGAG